MKRINLPISQFDKNEKGFKYEVENGYVHNNDDKEEQEFVEKKKRENFLKWLLIKSGIVEQDWTTQNLRITDKWMNWFYDYQKYMMFGAIALIITLIVMTLVYLNFFGPAMRITSFDIKEKLKVVQFENRKFSEWLKTVNTGEIKKADVESGIISAPFFLNDDTINVSISDMKQALERNCPLDGKDCLCLSALHLGIVLNSVTFNDFSENSSVFLIEPNIVSQSTQLIKIRIGKSKDPIESPSTVLIEYFLQSGKKTRKTFENEQAACILECLKKYKELEYITI